MKDLMTRCSSRLTVNATAISVNRSLRSMRVDTGHILSVLVDYG